MASRYSLQGSKIIGSAGGRTEYEKRMRGFRVGAAIYAVAMALLVIAYSIRLIGGPALLVSVGSALLVNLGFFAVFRLRLNERFADATLTLPADLTTEDWEMVDAMIRAYVSRREKVGK